MPRAVPDALAERRRARLVELLDAIGEVRGRRITQRDFSHAIGREQGTIAAILGGHRALGGDVLNAIVKVWGLPADAFDSERRPDFRAAVRATEALGDARPTVLHPSPRGSNPPARSVVQTEVPEALAEALEVLLPERAVTMALTWLAHRGATHDADGWALRAIGAQSANARGELTVWLDDALAGLDRREMAAVESLDAARPGPRAVVVHSGSAKSSRITRG